MSLYVAQEIEQLNADTYKGFHKKHPDKCRIRVRAWFINVYIYVNIPPQKTKLGRRSFRPSTTTQLPRVANFGEIKRRLMLARS